MDVGLMLCLGPNVVSTTS